MTNTVYLQSQLIKTEITSYESLSACILYSKLKTALFAISFPAD